MRGCAQRVRPNIVEGEALDHQPFQVGHRCLHRSGHIAGYRIEAKIIGDDQQDIGVLVMRYGGGTDQTRDRQQCAYKVKTRSVGEGSIPGPYRETFPTV